MWSLAVPFNIPDGWVWVHPTDIGFFGSGKTPAPDQLSKFGTIPYFKVADMNATGNEVYLCHSNSFLKLPNSMKLFSKGAVVYPKNGGAVFTNKKRILGQDSLVDLNTGSYTPFSQMDEKFFYYLFSTVDFQKYYKGTALPTVDMDAVQEIVWALPPLAEQKRIVTAIELTLPLIDKYEETHSQLSRLQHSFPEALKKSILQEAVQGKLVPQDPSDEPAEALLERIRAEKQRLIKEDKIKKDKHESVIFRRDNSHYEKRGSEVVCIDDEIPFDIPELWSWCRLNELCTKIGAGSTPTGGKTIYVPEGIKFIRSQNVYNDGLKLNDISYITEEINAKKKGSIVRSKDILLNITGGSIGRCAVVPDDFDIANVNQHVMIIRLVEPKMRHWIHTILISEYIQNLIMDVQVGVSREGLSATKLMNFLIPVPPISEQNRILDFCSNISNRLSTL